MNKLLEFLDDYLIFIVILLFMIGLGLIFSGAIKITDYKKDLMTQCIKDGEKEYNCYSKIYNTRY